GGPPRGSRGHRSAAEAGTEVHRGIQAPRAARSRCLPAPGRDRGAAAARGALRLPPASLAPSTRGGGARPTHFVEEDAPVADPGREGPAAPSRERLPPATAEARGDETGDRPAGRPRARTAGLQTRGTEGEAQAGHPGAGSDRGDRSDLRGSRNLAG